MSRSGICSLVGLCALGVASAAFGEGSRRPSELTLEPTYPVAASAAAGDGTTAPGAVASQPASKFRSPDDGWLDMSGFLDEAYGFLPVVMPVTEPAVGFGVAGALAFLDKPAGKAAAGFGRPNITAIGGVATENGTAGVGVGDIRHWMNDHLQTRVGLAHASVNLDFAGLGRDRRLRDDPLAYNLETTVGLIEGRYRLGDTPVWAGLRYTIASTDVSLREQDAGSRFPGPEGESRIGGLTPSLSYDSRDNIFTPTSGTYLEATVGFFSQAFGGDGEFQRLGLTAMHYIPLTPKLTLGLRGDAASTFGDTPFYARPFIMLRGAPAMRYQGEDMAQFEGELRWQFWERFSVVAFAGGGATWRGLERFDCTCLVGTGGVGVRYELARRYGLHMGLDVAFGPDGPAVYVQFGSAWARP